MLGIAPQPAFDPARRETLALLYQPVLTATVRIQAGREDMRNPERFRARIETTIDEIQAEARRRGFEQDDVRDTTYAAVAFLDEIALRAFDQWRLLQTKYYSTATAGEHFFEVLDDLDRRADSGKVAELLEVYLLCLMLGYKGRYAIGREEELKALQWRLYERMRRIRRNTPGLSVDHAPGWMPSSPKPKKRIAAPKSWLPVFAGIALIAVIVIWIIFRALLAQGASSVVSAIVESMKS